MSNAHYQYQYRLTASKRHKEVGQILREHPYFKNYSSYQEYPITKIDINYPNGRLMFDWAVPDLHLVIECQGEHHADPQRFGGISWEEAIEAFHGQQSRDRAKENACSEQGWVLIAIPPKIPITAEYLIEQYKLNFNPIKPVQKESTPNAKEEAYNKKKKEKARQIRKEQYQKQKEWAKGNKKIV